MWRGIAIGTALALLAVGVASGQGQRSPATLDDLLREVRALRGDLNESLRSTTRSRLVMGRVQVQEQRIATLKHGNRGVEHAIRSGNLVTERARQLEKELADVKDRLLREQRMESELRYREADLVSTLAIEQDRWTDFNSRLDDLERALSR